MEIQLFVLITLCEASLEFHDHIWNHREKGIQTSTNMHGIVALTRKIHIKISEI